MTNSPGSGRHENSIEAWLQEIEAAAAEIVEVGDLLFGRAEPSDPALQRRYQLYTWVKAALALPMGPERITAWRRRGTFRAWLRSARRCGNHDQNRALTRKTHRVPC